MGCYFRCFRLRDADRPKTHLVSKSIASKRKNPLVTKNQFASVLKCEGKGSPCEKVGHLSLQETFDKESTDEELKLEAQFLKSCGALLETPAEIRKASKKTMVQSQDVNGVRSDFHSDTFCRKLWDEQPCQISDIPAKVHGESHHQQNKSEGLSQWLKPPPPKADRWNMKDVSLERSHSGKSYVSERPIIGTMAAHWNDEEPSHVTPKWFDGNGIPNSTNKYKEDQKVSWHATPFEERLEKALSDEKFFPQRKLDGSLNKLDDEGEESDTAAT